MTSELPRQGVPCGTCHLCCMMVTRLFPEKGDNPKQYRTKMHFHRGQQWTVLERKESGECVYLTESGCSIHSRAPFVCRDFDCRTVFKQLSRPERRRLTKASDIYQAIVARGKELLGT